MDAAKHERSFLIFPPFFVLFNSFNLKVSDPLDSVEDKVLMQVWSPELPAPPLKNLIVTDNTKSRTNPIMLPHIPTAPLWVRCWSER